jgi:hypothetical protein
MNTTSTGEMTPDEVALEILKNAPLKDSSLTYGYEAGEAMCFADYYASLKEKTKTGGTSEKKTDPQNRMEQVLADLESRSKPSSHFMNRPVGRHHIKDLILVGQVGVMIGAWKAGKTFSALHLSFCIAWGRPVFQPRTEFGKPAKPVGEVRLSGNVLYIPSEGVAGIADRIKAYRQYYKHLITDAGDVIVYDQAFDVFEEASLTALSIFCTKHRIVFIVIDTLASNLAGLALEGRSNPENDNALMSAMFLAVQHSVTEKQKHGCSAMFIHHPCKGENSTDARGGGGIEASARFKLTIKTKEDGNRTLALGFNNDLPDETPFSVPFRLESVNIGVTEDGDPRNVGVFQCGGVKANDGRPAELLFAFSKMMDENQEADRLDFHASVKTLYPEWKDNTFRFYLSKAVRSGYLELLTKKAGRNQRYRLTELGLSNVPEVKSDV